MRSGRLPGWTVQVLIGAFWIAGWLALILLDGRDVSSWWKALLTLWFIVAAAAQLWLHHSRRCEREAGEERALEEHRERLRRLMG